MTSNEYDELTWADCEALLSEISSNGVVPIVVGGQAVAFWVDYYEIALGDALVSSKDLDLLGNSDHVKRCARLVRGSARVPPLDHATPESGFVEVERGTRRLRIDFIPDSRPNSAEEVKDTAVEFLMPWGAVKVMHPLACLKSRAFNVAKLPHKYDNPHGLAQLAAALKVFERFCGQLLEQERIPSVRALYRKAFAFSKTDVAASLWRKHRVDLFDAVVPHPELGEDFVQSCYPRWKARIHRVPDSSG